MTQFDMNEVQLSRDVAVLTPATVTDRPQRRVAPYRVAPALRAELRRVGCFKADNLQGILQVLEDWVVVLATIVLSQAAFQYLPWVPALGIYGLATLVIGARQRGLRVNNHQASHKALAQNKKLNYLLGAVCSAWPTLGSFSSYDKTHNSVEHGHHPNLGTERDADHIAVMNLGLYESGVTPEQVYRFLWMLPLKTPHYLLFLLKHQIWHPCEDRRERVVRLIAIVLLGTLLWKVGLGVVVVMYWVVPLLTTANWIGGVIQLAQHYPLLGQGHQSELVASRNRILNPAWSFFLSVHNDGYHLVHHLYPSIPFGKKVKQAHQILMKDPQYASLHQEPQGMGLLLKQLANVG